MEQQLYKKIGRKYVPIGYSDGFTGFPSEGIWIVYSKPGAKTNLCIAKMGEFESIDYRKLANSIKDLHEDMCKVLQQSGKTDSDIATDIIKLISRK